MEPDVWWCFCSAASIFTQNYSLSAAVVAGRQGAKSFLPRRVLRRKMHWDQERYAQLPLTKVLAESCLWTLFVIRIMQKISFDAKFFQSFRAWPRVGVIKCWSQTGSHNWTQESFIEKCHSVICNET